MFDVKNTDFDITEELDNYEDITQELDSYEVGALYFILRFLGEAYKNKALPVRPLEAHVDSIMAGESKRSEDRSYSDFIYLFRFVTRNRLLKERHLAPEEPDKLIRAMMVADPFDWRMAHRLIGDDEVWGEIGELVTQVPDDPAMRKAIVENATPRHAVN